jgi:hypothetical protein
MTSLSLLKEREQLETPLILFECQRPSGAIDHWSTHHVTIDGLTYEAMVVKHKLFDLRAGFADGIDTSGKLTLTLNNIDSRFSQIERAGDWKGARLIARFAFVNLTTMMAASDPIVIFLGRADRPELATDLVFQLPFVSRLSLHRTIIPSLRVQRFCPWSFPETPQQQVEALGLSNNGRYSIYFGCGYSAGQIGGCGNLDNGLSYTSCDHTRAHCEKRGMYAFDDSGRKTGAFGGFEFLISSTQVRGYGDRAQRGLSAAARYNNFVPLVYGTAWHTAEVISYSTSGDLVTLDALIALGPIESVERVLMNGYELANIESDSTAPSGCYEVLGPHGTGATDGEPHGGMVVIRVRTQKRLAGENVPQLLSLTNGLKLERYSASGTMLDRVFTRNPAWVILDVLRRSGWNLTEIDLTSFARTATYCDSLIQIKDAHGLSRTLPRFEVNLALTAPRSVADVIRGVRNASALCLTFGVDGRLQVFPEATICDQQPTKPLYSNSQEPLQGGWPAYEFGDGTSGTTGILRRVDLSPSFRSWSQSSAETPNRFTVEFQDSQNEYQQDSYSVVDVEDVNQTGQEISATATSLGLPSMCQADRILRFLLLKSIKGNFFIEFETSVRAIGLRPGDIVAVTYQREGLLRQPFRILRIEPTENYGSVKLTAQVHDDDWYLALREGSDEAALRWRISGALAGIPRPLSGKIRDELGDDAFLIREMPQSSDDGSGMLTLIVGFTPPRAAGNGITGIPIVGAAEVEPDGGSLIGGKTLYYAISGADGAGNETEMSFFVEANLPAGHTQCRVLLNDIALPEHSTRLHVYRGYGPETLKLIADLPGPVSMYEDLGAPAGTIPPPDNNYSHANFYWRFESLPETPANIFAADEIGSHNLALLGNEFTTCSVAIVRGKGAGEERSILSHDGTTIRVTSPWTEMPDASSVFVVCEPSWHGGSSATGDSVSLLVPNRAGMTIQVTGRAANVRNVESPPEQALVTRWRLDGTSGAGLDADVPGEPTLAISTMGDGFVEVGGIGFSSLANTRSIQAGTLTLHYRNELTNTSHPRLQSGIDAGDSMIVLQSSPPVSENQIVLLEKELVRVIESQEAGNLWRVERSCFRTESSEHAAGSQAALLERRTVVLPFVRGFFGSAASGSFSNEVFIPDVCIEGAEFFVTNKFGDSPTHLVSFTNTSDVGLRTLSGGQYCIQLGGLLAAESTIAPPLIIDATHSVRDICATVQEAPQLEPVLLRLRVDGASYCDLEILPASTRSNTVSGVNVPPLTVNSAITADIVSVGTAANSTPGRDLTITIRL